MPHPIRVFTALFTALTGESSDASLVITTLILATTFTPIKTRLEGVVSSLWATPGGDGSSEREGTPAAASGAVHAVEPPAVDYGDPALLALIDERIRAALAGDPAAATGTGQTRDGPSR